MKPSLLCVTLVFSADGCEVWGDSFGHRLRLREASAHSKCSTCTKYKLLLKKLAGNRIAYEKQLKEYQHHLSRQYADRTVYWQSRTQSRLPQSSGESVITVILDSMDHAKYKWPRTLALRSKDLHGFNRPHLVASAAIAHGRTLVMILGHGNVAKDSSWSCELLLHVLDRCCARGEDLRNSTLYIQGDNCSRELKNNSLLRLASTLVGLRRVKNIQIRFLETGHSHEDIDGFFAQVKSWIERETELLTPDAFRSSLMRFLNDPAVRPHEPDREVSLVDAVRDWNLGP